MLWMQPLKLGNPLEAMKTSRTYSTVRRWRKTGTKNKAWLDPCPSQRKDISFCMVHWFNFMAKRDTSHLKIYVLKHSLAFRHDWRSHGRRRIQRSRHALTCSNDDSESVNASKKSSRGQHGEVHFVTRMMTSQKRELYKRNTGNNK